MLDEEIAFQLMRLYRVLRGTSDAASKAAARREIDRLLHEMDAQATPQATAQPPDATRLHR